MSTIPDNAIALSPETAAAILDALAIATRSVHDDIRRMEKRREDAEIAASQEYQSDRWEAAERYRETARTCAHQIRNARALLDLYERPYGAMSEIAGGVTLADAMRSALDD